VSLTSTSLEDSILLDFAAACADLAEAKQAVRTEDTPAARVRLQACVALVDAVLDLGNASVRGQRRSTATLSAPEATGSSNTS